MSNAKILDSCKFATRRYYAILKTTHLSVPDLRIQDWRNFVCHWLY